MAISSIDTELKNSSTPGADNMPCISAVILGLSVRSHIRAWVSSKIRIEIPLYLPVKRLVADLPVLWETPLAF